MKYRIKLSSRRKATGEHTFEVSSFFGVKSFIEWNSNSGYFNYLGNKPTVYYGLYSTLN